eukprot:TRINITY_DN102577_c0_g1_i1.p1 TRINITY_DN102577_c0_g1~~TRINITY_DN102577_c0_g1_i1.p1  ORF type:complete len:499 (-),score=115.45 TRINITY_DN102577_c0_g1_i1:141-1637(-)
MVIGLNAAAKAAQVNGVFSLMPSISPGARRKAATPRCWRAQEAYAAETEDELAVQNALRGQMWESAGPQRNRRKSAGAMQQQHLSPPIPNAAAGRRPRRPAPQQLPARPMSSLGEEAERIAAMLQEPRPRPEALPGSATPEPARSQSPSRQRLLQSRQQQLQQRRPPSRAGEDLQDAWAEPPATAREPASASRPPETAKSAAPGTALKGTVNRSIIRNGQPDLAQLKNWTEKYMFFSGGHIHRALAAVQKARKDPFNKDPAWGKAVVSKVAKYCTEQGMDPASMFELVDTDNNGILDRVELRKALERAPNLQLSPLEVAAIFDAIDTDGGGDVSVDEFVAAIEASKRMGLEEKQEAMDRYRNPMFRLKHFSPARIDGWDHIPPDPSFRETIPIRKVCETKREEIMSRLKSVLRQNPKALKHEPIEATKYQNFCGGGDSDRFHRQEWRRSRPNSCDTKGTNASVVSSIPDPVTEPRPGWLCDPSSRAAVEKAGFRLARP